MSEIVENLKDAIDPTRREKATVPTYDPEQRGPYADKPSAGQVELDVPKAGVDGSTAGTKSSQVKAT
ncbi:hypothetical protein QBC39DRAFT_368203 [Podospora conica]|nr:hypothetical protein QBC39DRAFT_368203 [Schizothecium conicum]